HAVQCAATAAVRRAVAADQRAAYDRSAERSDPARAEQPASCYVQRPAGIVQRTREIQHTPRAIEVAAPQITRREGAAEVPGAAVKVDRPGIAPGGVVIDRERAAVHVRRATVGEGGGTEGHRPGRRIQYARVGERRRVDGEGL